MTTTDVTTTFAGQHHHSSRGNLKRRIPSAGRLTKLAALATKTTPIKSTTSLHHRSHSKQSLHDTDTESDDDQGESTMSTTFLQYCASCEKQIEVPCVSRLYCSERCRKQDVRSSQCYALFSQDTPTPITLESRPSSSERIEDIIPQFSPTIAPRPFNHSHHSSSSINLLPENELSTPGHDRPKRSATNRADSEAAHHLAQFSRPTHERQYSAAAIDSAPSLSSTANSTPATSPILSRPFTPVSYTSRPPTGRRDRWGGSVSSKSVDLVTPVHCPTTAPSSLMTITEKAAKLSVSTYEIPSVGDGGVVYEKRRTMPSSELLPGNSSLKQMFRFDEMSGRR